ncbi:hypothetical protein EASAB2608_06118 [Streptomyces sp. EAS-AB2608]|nr:hypothetical protein EASAB2608_06118 [Streptomyces sp. EAS-AB2608]
MQVADGQQLSGPGRRLHPRTPSDHPMTQQEHIDRSPDKSNPSRVSASGPPARVPRRDGRPSRRPGSDGPRARNTRVARRGPGKPYDRPDTSALKSP